MRASIMLTIYFLLCFQNVNCQDSTKELKTDVKNRNQKIEKIKTILKKAPLYCDGLSPESCIPIFDKFGEPTNDSPQDVSKKIRKNKKTAPKIEEETILWVHAKRESKSKPLAKNSNATARKLNNSGKYGRFTSNNLDDLFNEVRSKLGAAFPNEEEDCHKQSINIIQKDPGHSTASLSGIMLQRYSLCVCEENITLPNKIFSPKEIQKANALRKSKGCSVPPEYQKIENDYNEVRKLNKKLAPYQSQMQKLNNGFNEELSGKNHSKWLEYKSSLNTAEELMLNINLQNDLSISDREVYSKRYLAISQTIIEIFKVGLDVGTAFTPFVNDARDLYELSTGLDLVSGEEIGVFGRACALAGLVTGSGQLYRKIFNGISDSKVRGVLSNADKGIPSLKFVKGTGWVSEKGITYLKPSGEKENRLRHVLRHAFDRVTRIDGKRDGKIVWKSKFSKEYKIKDIPSLIDEAWTKRGAGKDINDKRTTEYLIDMGKPVGENGEQKILIVMMKGTSNIITAFPKK